VNRRLRVASVPEDINTCLPQLDPSGDEGGEKHREQFIQKLSQKFFPLKKSPPPPFFEKIFDLVANTCYSTCKMDKVIKLLEDARAVVMTSLVPSSDT